MNESSGGMPMSDRIFDYRSEPRRPGSRFAALVPLAVSSADLNGEVSLVNVFASWCVACRAEHPLFMELKAKGIVPIHGLNYKDRPADAEQWLNELGDPYTRTGADINGRVGIDWGVYGGPETFLIDRPGRIAYKQIGPLNPQGLEKT